MRLHEALEQSQTVKREDERDKHAIFVSKDDQRTLVTMDNTGAVQLAVFTLDDIMATNWDPLNC